MDEMINSIMGLKYNTIGANMIIRYGKILVKGYIK